MPKLDLVAIYFVKELSTTSVFRGIVPLLLALVTMLTAIACHGNHDSGGGGIKIGSKDFTEQFILGEIYALAIENKGFKVKQLSQHW